MAANARTTFLPMEHLDAELLAIPFASRVAFSNSILALDAAVRGSTSALWRETEKELLNRFPGISIDELITRRDDIWFEKPGLSKNRSLLTILRQGAQKLFRGKGRTDSSLSESYHIQQRWKWRWVTFALPSDLIYAAAGIPEVVDNWLSFTMRQALADRGFAETHLHLKAALSFSDIWASAQYAIAASDATETMFKGAGAEFDEGNEFAPWLVRCALARLSLAGFLCNPRWQNRGLSEYLKFHVLPELISIVGPVSAALFYRGLQELAVGRVGAFSPPFQILRGIYAYLSACLSINQHSQIESSQFDPLHRWFPSARGHSPETGFLLTAFEYLESASGRNDRPFAHLFWQTQRLRVLFYRHLIQRPMTPGLQWFTRTFARLKAPRRPLPLCWFVNKAHDLAGDGLRSLEIRIVPENTMPELLHVVNEIDEAAQKLEMRESGLEVGVVFHFARTRGKNAEAGIPQPWGQTSHDDPGMKSNPSGYRFASYYLEQRNQAEALSNLLLTFPRTLERIRGIDICTDELGVPLWVMLPLVFHVRQAGLHAAARLANSVPALRTTVHAGEDFVHLLGGIRRVGEAVEWLGLADGDRIGHGVAIGMNIEEWASRAKSLAVPCGERLLDLIWAWRVAMKSSSTHLQAWVSWITQEVERLTTAIFRKTCPLPVLDEWLKVLHSPKMLALTGFPMGPCPQSFPIGSLELAAEWLCDKSVFQRAQMLEHVQVASEVPLISELQSSVRSILASRGIIIEINPSSNLLIGHLGDLNGHPLWRLCPPRGNGQDSIRICIGSDDPITFATRLPQEYQLIWDALVVAGVSSYEADAWLDRARQTGLAGRFTVKRSRFDLTTPFGLNRIPIIP